jgi:hypothetical protein
MSVTAAMASTSLPPEYCILQLALDHYLLPPGQECPFCRCGPIATPGELLPCFFLPMMEGRERLKGRRRSGKELGVEHKEPLWTDFDRFDFIANWPRFGLLLAVAY